MDLKEYIGEKLNITELARELDYSRVHIAQVLHGRIRAGKKLARAIERITNGKVTAAEILERNKLVKK